MILVGRRAERDALDWLTTAARGGESGVLVLCGEPGIGKTTLLEYATESASGFRVAGAVGVESEAELAFAALHQLCGPMLDHLDRLPEPQQAALGAAFGLSEGIAPERFLVGLACLSLLSAVAEEQPLLCVIDDAQWLDRASAQALAFLARRLLADPIAIIFATRVVTEQLAGLPELVVGGLDDDDARRLLASTVSGPIDARVRDRIIRETGGNPLALLELPRGLTPAQLAVGFGLPEAQPLARRIEQSFRRRAEDLPPETRRLLLVAAVEQAGDALTVWRAASRLGIDADAAEAAATAGLMDIGSEVKFRHPLVRSAIYRAASSQDRREVHMALADATDRENDSDRRAWHIAEATLAPDEDVAAELERCAGRAQERGGIAAAAAFLERSAQLTPDPHHRALRLLLAAAGQVTAGDIGRAQALLEQSVPNLADPGARAQALHLEGAIRFFDGRGADTPGLLLDAARGLAEVDLGLARETLLEALESAMWAGGLSTGPMMLDVAREARGMPAAADDAGMASLLLSGYTERLTNSYADGVEWWRRAASVPCDLASIRFQGMLWNATGELMDLELHSMAGRERVRLAREHGALAWLPVSLSCLAWSERLAGRIEAAESLTAEAVEIGAAIGTPATHGAQELIHLGMLCWRGSDDARPTAEAVIAEGVARGQGLTTTIAHCVLATLELGLGRYEEARVHALKVFDEDPPYVASMSLADVVEATSRSGDGEAARAALARLTDRALATGTPWALGLLARARALLQDSDSAEDLYAESIDHLARSGVATELARSRLLYGEWLRRRRRRRDARTQLRTALEMFEAMGGGAFARRTSVELQATGERARVRVDETRDQLTPQEVQIAQLAANGETNADIAAQLFISPHTVAYHLRKVYGKLGVTSRGQLAAATSALAPRVLVLEA